MTDLNLTPEQEVEARRLAQLWRTKTDAELLQLACLLVSKPDAELLGATEFEVRDHAHRLAAAALETALHERKKGGTRGRASPARTARKRPASRHIARKPSSV